MKQNSNSSIKLISLFPLLLLLSLSLYFVYVSYGKYQNNIKLESKMQSNKILKNLSINLAKERGFSAIYYGSDGKLAKIALKKQRVKTNEAIRKFNNYFRNKPLDETITRIFKGLTNITTIRSSVNKLGMSFNKIFFGYYSKINELIYDDYIKINNIQLISEISPETVLETDLFKEMEKTGQERGFIAYILTKKRPFSTKEYTAWIKLFSSVDLSTINISSVNKDLRNRLFILLHSYSSTQLYKKLIKAKINIIDGGDIGYYQISPSQWFRLMTGKISLLNRADSIVSVSIENNAKNWFDNVIRPQLTLAIGVLILTIFLMIVGFFIDRYIKKSIKELEKLFTKVGQLADIEEEIDFQTTEGIEKGYRIIEIAIDQIQQDKRIALEASKAKSIFLANMSHEIRTPLNGIIGFTELLKNTNISGEERDFVDIIEKSSENLLEIINNILDLSKIESDKIEVEEILFSPITEFENAVEVFAAKAAEKNIRLSFYMDPSLSNYLNGDPTKIKEVLVNLLSNAVKFTPIDGEIDIEIKRVKSADAFGRTKIQFVVKDNGIGISEDKLKTIFDAFSQADSTITRKYGGTGLGLTISSKFISIMGGKLEVESKEGKGTKFFFTLEFDESPSGEASFKDTYIEYKCALLSSESDRKNHTQYLYDYLKYFGCDVVFFYGHREIKDLLKRENINFIIMDVDYVRDEEIEEYKKLQIPSIIILKSSMQVISNKYTNNFIKSLYEPVNVTKLTNILEKEKSSLPKITERTDDKAISIKDDMKEIPENRVSEVLVAEDNEINRKLIKRTLENYDIKVSIANDGKEALEYVKSKKFDLIFMDIAMPVMDGVEALHAILNYELSIGAKHTPIVALTANALKGDRERFLNEGFDEYVTKPIRNTSIEFILDMFLNKNEDIANDTDIKELENLPEKANEELTISLNDRELGADRRRKDEKNIYLDKQADETGDMDKTEIRKLKINSTDDGENFYDSGDIDTTMFESSEEDKSFRDDNFEDKSYEDILPEKIDNKDLTVEIQDSFDNNNDDKLDLQEKEELDTTQDILKKTDYEKSGQIEALIAEDNIINQKLIEKTLKNLGLKTDIANDGEEALKMFKEKNYDIVFMDISMPVMDGIEATHEILSYENINSLKHTPVIALTANALPGDREAFLAEGLDEYISKPLKKEDLIKVLKIFVNYQDKDIVQKADESKTQEHDYDIEMRNSKENIFAEDEDMDNNFEFKEHKKENIKDMDVLIFKNNKIEAKILNNIINKLGYSVEFINNFDEFMYNIDTKQYKIIFFDKNIEFVESKDIIDKIRQMDQSRGNQSAIIEFVSVQDVNKDEDLPVADEIMDNVIDKKNIMRILEKYIR